MTSVASNLRPPSTDGAAALPFGVLTDDLVPVADLGAGRGPRWLDEWLDANLALVMSWRRTLHANPELRRAEFRTTATIVGILRSLGLRPRVLPAGTGVICEVGSGPRCVALRADIDALAVPEATGEPWASRVPGVSHACGHDVHTAILLGAAAALASAPSLPCRVRLLFQPAEEEPGGAHDVIAAGGVEGVERIFGLHCDPKVPVGRIGTKVGPVTSACDMLDLRVVACGTGRRNELSSDVVHALGVVATGLPAMLARRVDPRSGTVLAWGLMDAPDTTGGTPRAGVLRGTLRTGDPVVNGQLPALVEEIVGSLLRPTGVRFELEHVRAVPVVDNDPESTALLRRAIAEALGPRAVASATQSTGGEDFGWYLEHVPGSYARLGTWSGEGPQGDLHQPTFHADERALPIGVRAMVHAALAVPAAG
ncbi:amidohydrolase [Saccharothrix saharensis]|uniref:Amidohydrolase n=1 Tax=Saccharothrix saharensis TaxID=571190 RepID=A0A543J657_9PSEU|nr:amidohydrolase [Saccharothrix saharensis]TQM78325.1 amidohydrolase [Saccharothrix saharensis]